VWFARESGTRGSVTSYGSSLSRSLRRSVIVIPRVLVRFPSYSANSLQPFRLMMTAMRSPTTPRSEVSSPRQKFDSEMLKGYMKKLLPATLQSSVWPPSKDRDQVKLWIKEIGERVKERMLGAW
jgi:hypothetical protein